MIRSFADKRAVTIFLGEDARELPPNIRNRARTRLLAIHAARSLDDLRAPPGNRLQALRGDRKGQYSVRINRQWRVCFFWIDGHAHEVRIVDYH